MRIFKSPVYFGKVFATYFTCLRGYISQISFNLDPVSFSFLIGNQELWNGPSATEGVDQYMK